MGIYEKILNSIKVIHTAISHITRYVKISENTLKEYKKIGSVKESEHVVDEMFKILGDRLIREKDYIVNYEFLKPKENDIYSSNWFVETYSSGKKVLRCSTTIPKGKSNKYIYFPESYSFNPDYYIVLMTPTNNGSVVDTFGAWNGSGNIEKGSGYFTIGVNKTSEWNVTFDMEVVYFGNIV